MANVVVVPSPARVVIDTGEMATTWPTSCTVRSCEADEETETACCATTAVDSEWVPPTTSSNPHTPAAAATAGRTVYSANRLVRPGWLRCDVMPPQIPGCAGR